VPSHPQISEDPFAPGRGYKEAVYRADLGFDGTLNRACQHLENVWSLHGLYECLMRRNDKVEAPLIKSRLDLALARAEVPIRASCACRREVAAAA